MAKRPNFRTDSTLGKLPGEAQQALDRFIREVKGGDRYDAAVDHLALDGIKVSRSAVWAWHSAWKLHQDISEADSIVSDFEEMMRASESGISPEQIEAVGQLLFTKLAMKNHDADEYRQMEYLKLAKITAGTKARQKDADLALASRRVALLEQNAAKAKEKLEAVKSAGGLTPETLREIEEAAKLL